jgi:hypothetical protein
VHHAETITARINRTDHREMTLPFALLRRCEFGKQEKAGRLLLAVMDWKREEGERKNKGKA